MKKYTIGEIFRKKLLLNHKGEPYKDKASVSKALASYPCEVQKTAFGPAKLYTEATIRKANSRWD